jgi:hypothetical protein
MGFRHFGKKIAKVAKLGQKVAKGVGIGIKRSVQIAKKVAPVVQAVSQAGAIIALESGMPLVAGGLETVSLGAGAVNQLAKKYGKTATKVGDTLEKIGDYKYKEAFEGVAKGHNHQQAPQARQAPQAQPRRFPMIKNASPAPRQVPMIIFEDNTPVAPRATSVEVFDDIP